MEMKEKLKRNFWQDSEIECMLNLIKEVQKHQGTTATTHNTFVQIANKMKKQGFSSKSPTQIRRKWFQMKSAYLCYKRGNNIRLLLIPEKFRSVIGQFIQNDLKNDTLGFGDDLESQKRIDICEYTPNECILTQNITDKPLSNSCLEPGNYNL